MVSLKSDDRTLHQRSTPNNVYERPADERLLSETSLPQREVFFSSHTFLALNGTSRMPQRFHPNIKVHTPSGEDALSLAQALIPHACPECRLRSDYLAQTLQIFARKVSDLLPEGYSVQIALSPEAGHAATDVVHLIRQAPDGTGQPLLERHYSPFDGGSVGGIIPSDQAKNVVLKIEERLFYYTTFLAIRKAIENEIARREKHSTERGEQPKAEG